MRVVGMVLAIVVIGAKMAFAAGPGACMIVFEKDGLARLQAPAAIERRVGGLCDALVQAMADRPDLARALARQEARIHLHVHTDRPHQLAVQMILHLGHQTRPGTVLTLGQVDGGPPGFDSATLSRLARHLLDAPPFLAFSTQP